MNLQNPNTRSPLLSLLHLHLTWYPLMEIRDAYKLLYQGAMGPEHMVATRQEFTRRLESEFESLSPDHAGRLLEPVRTDQALFRLNLRPYKALHSSMNPLISPLLLTSRLYHGDQAELTISWAELLQLVEQNELTSFPKPDVLNLSRWLEQEDFPAVHHTEAYRQAYHPSYRLVAIQFIQELETHASS